MYYSIEYTSRSKYTNCFELAFCDFTKGPKHSGLTRMLGLRCERGMSRNIGVESSALFFAGAIEF